MTQKSGFSGTRLSGQIKATFRFVDILICQLKYLIFLIHVLINECMFLFAGAADKYTPLKFDAPFSKRLSQTATNLICLLSSKMEAAGEMSTCYTLLFSPFHDHPMCIISRRMR
jgi:hypothetical protein